MATGRKIGTAAALGAALGVAGVLLLLFEGAANVGVDWFANPPAPPRSWLENLNAWNATRELGAGLVVLGSILLVAALSVLVGRSRGGRLPRHALVVARGLSAALVLVGLVVLVYPRQLEVSYEGTYRLIRAPAEPLPPTNVATMVWTDDQVVAALVVVGGLLLGTCCTGLVLGRRHFLSVGRDRIDSWNT